MRKHVLLRLIICYLLPVMLFSCLSRQKQTIFDVINQMPAKQLKNFEFDNTSSLAARAGDIPVLLLDYLKQMDNTQAYQPARLSAEEETIIAACIELLPSLYKQVLKDRLVGIYFVDNWLGSGMADYLVDEDWNLYPVLVFNPETLRHSMTDWLSYREQTCFSADDSGQRVEVACGSEYTGFMLILLHEAGHAVDYLQQYTPFVEESTRQLKGIAATARTVFTGGIWQGYNLPEPGSGQLLPYEVTFYGMGGGPKIPLRVAPEVYQALAASPFCSLYASLSWAEDFAELAAWEYYTRQLNQPYEIRIYQGDILLWQFRPLDSEKVRQRIETLPVPD